MSFLSDIQAQSEKLNALEDVRTHQRELRDFLHQQQDRRLEILLEHPVSSRETLRGESLTAILVGDMVFTEPLLDTLDENASRPLLSVLSVVPLEDGPVLLEYPVRSRQDVVTHVADSPTHVFESEAVLALLANDTVVLSPRGLQEYLDEFNDDLPF